MRVYVTGASGFIGGHVVRELRAAGADVGVEWIDLGDRERLRGAIEGCDAVFHLAALLHTSTAGSCGPVEGREATEEDAPPDWELAVPYKRTKLEAERIVLAAAREGLDAVVVNPTTPVGDGDRFPTPTGRMIEGIATGRYRAYLRATGVNVVDVRDVASGHLLALERGLSGERYILGGANLTLRELFGAVAELAGRPRPRIGLPYTAARALGRARLANPEEVALARLPMWFSSAKAERELGYRPGPLWPALARAVREALDRTRMFG